MKKLALPALILIVAALAVYFFNREEPSSPATSIAPAARDAVQAEDGGRSGEGLPEGDDVFARAFESRASGVPVEGEGSVTRILGDDVDGSRHQRFIVRLKSGQTILIAHNIDLAPRVENLRAGDSVVFRGVYEWNRNGGTVHWTHRDPEGRHRAGWIRHRGRMVQ